MLFRIPNLMMCDIINVQLILGVAFYMLKIIWCDILNSDKLAFDILKIFYYYV